MRRNRGDGAEEDRGSEDDDSSSELEFGEKEVASDFDELTAPGLNFHGTSSNPNSRPLMESRPSSSDDEGAEDDSGVVSEGGKIELASKEVKEGVDTPSLSTSSISAILREEGVEIISIESSQEDGTPPTEKKTRRGQGKSLG